MFKLVAIGINVVDIYPSLRKMYPGGNELNISYFINKLGGQSSFIGVFADDHAGRLLFSLLCEHGVDVSHCRHESGSSGYAIVELIGGDRVFTDFNRHGVTDLHPIRFTPEDISFIQGHDVACISCNSRLNLDGCAALYQTGVPVCYDFSDGFDEENMKSHCPLTHFAFFSCSHLEDDAVKRLLSKAVDFGTKIAVGTMGPHGALAFDGNRYFRCPAKQVSVVDTMGAGDSFLAAFLNCFFRCAGSCPEQAIDLSLQAGAAFAARTVGSFGSLGIGYDIDSGSLSGIIGEA